MSSNEFLHLFDAPFTVFDTLLRYAAVSQDRKTIEYIYNCLDSSNSLPIFLSQLVTREITNFDSEQTAFRQNSALMKMINVIYTKTGVNFLYQSLSKLFCEIEEKDIKFKNVCFIVKL